MHPHTSHSFLLAALVFSSYCQSPVVSHCHVGAASCLQAKIDEAAEKEEERLALLQAEQNEETLRLEGPVWMLRTQCMRFDCPEGRPQVKALAAQLAAKFCDVPTKKASKKKKKLVPYADDDEAY
eukprot:5639403-Pyramimonas_sp.AAC.2